MEKYIFENDLKVFGIEVKTFPAGISEAFDELIKITGDCAGAREYYGVSSMNSEGKIIYKAVAAEKNKGEAENFNYEQSIIEKGEYLYKELKDWRNNTNCIKEIFMQMMQDDKVNKAKPVLNGIKMMKKCYV